MSGAIPKLKAVPDAEPEEPIDIYAADKAKIATIDWAKVHIRGDRAEPISIADRVRSVVRR